MEQKNERLTLYKTHSLSHWYLIGASGSGKTTLLKNLMVQKMRRGDGFCFVDLHGDAPFELLGNTPASRCQDVVYYDPTSPFAPAFNILKLPYPPDKIASDLSSLFEAFSKGSWGPRLADILRGALLTLIYDMRDSDTTRTLLDLRYFLLSEDFRNDLIEKSKRDSIKEFWELDYPKLGRQEIAPVLNKINQFLAPESLLRRIFSEPDNELDFRKIMDERKILLCRLARGKLGDEPARILGSAIIRGVQQAALSREDIPEDKRLPFFLIVDEFENFAPEPFESILAETRKYKVYLTLAHQLLHQTPVTLRQHVFSNAKVWVSFRVSYDDARVLQQGMHTKRLLAHSLEDGKDIPFDQFMRFVRNTLLYHRGYTYDSANSGWSHAHLARMELKELDELLELLDSPKGAKDTVLKRILKYRILKYEVDSTFNDNDREIFKVRWVQGNRIFDDYEFREVTFPDVEDLTKLPDHHAFCRLGRSDNVSSFKTFPAPPPDESIRQAILSEHQHRFDERMRRRQFANEYQRPTPPPNERPKKKKPKNDDDFLN